MVFGHSGETYNASPYKALKKDSRKAWFEVKNYHGA
jgi:hypothetical protein